jgi:hypothetical protein
VKAQKKGTKVAPCPQKNVLRIDKTPHPVLRG